MVPWRKSALPYHLAPDLPRRLFNPILEMARPTSADAYNAKPLEKRTTVTVPIVDPSRGGIAPQAINNKAFFALFAFIGVGMALASIWFFFWAKNGGFVWRKRDWDDYKTTVLRRKGRDGRTLSAATTRTNLGQPSIAGTFDIEKEAMNAYKKPNFRPGMIRHVKDTGTRERTPSDDDVKAYRHEKAAKVGGINRAHDGSRFDYSTDTTSDIVSNDSKQALNPPRKQGFVERRREQRQHGQRTRSATKESPVRGKDNNRRRYSFAADGTSNVENESSQYSRGEDASDSYYSNYRPEIPVHHAGIRKPTRSRQSSPTKPSHGSRPIRLGPALPAQHTPDYGRANGNPGFRRGGRIGSYGESDEDLTSMRY